MIKIRLDKKKIEELITLHEQILSPPYKIQETLSNLLKSCPPGSAKEKFYSYIQKELKQILLGTPKQLATLLPTIEPLYEDSLKENSTTLKSELAEIFNYGAFVSNYNGYGAYGLIEEIKVKVCPYCNRISTVVAIADRGRTRPRIDHWLAKSTHPYLALSLFNLVPCCHICNSDFKGSHEFDFDNFLHPYLNGYEKEYKFSLKPTVVPEDISSGDDFAISMKPLMGAPSGHCRMAKKTAAAFNIIGVYNEEKEIALSVIKDSGFFSQTALEEQLELRSKTTGKPVYKNLDELIERRFKLRSNSDDYCKEAFSKFKRDLAEDLGLVFPLQ